MSRRGPIIAGAVAGVLALLAIFFLVLPKTGEVSDAKDKLAAAEEMEQKLRLQLQQLQADKAAAPKARLEIREINNLVPPTVDLPAIYLLLRDAAARSGVGLPTVAPAPPAAAAEAGVGTFNTIPVSVSVTGDYFQVEEFLYNIETLARAAKVTNISLSPSAAPAVATTSPSPGTTTTTTSMRLALQASIEFYTTDLSAGPGSIPGPGEQAAEAGA